MLIPRVSPTFAQTGQLCLLLLFSPGVFLAVASLFLSFIISTSGSGQLLVFTKKLRTENSAGRVKLIVHSRCCPNCPNHPHLELPHSRSEPHLTSGLAPPSLSRVSCWVCVCSWAPACGFWGLVCCCCGTWSWLQLPPVVFGAMGLCPITEGGHPLPLGAFPARTASSAPRCSGDTSLQPAGEF